MTRIAMIDVPAPCQFINSNQRRSLHVVAHGDPAAQGSKKAFVRGSKVNMVEMSKKLPGWRATVKAAAKHAAGPDWKPLDGPLTIRGEIRLHKPRTTKYPDHPAGPPDLDKLQRAIGDALTQSCAIADDARIVHWDIRKVWAENIPGMDIEIAEIGQPERPKNPGI